jgi:hypothetical protein
MKKLLVLALGFFFVSTSLGVQPASAQKFIEEWLFLGPIQGTGHSTQSIITDYLEEIGGEVKAKPSEGQQTLVRTPKKGKAAVQIKDQKLKWEKKMIVGHNLEGVFGPGDNVSMYACVYFSSNSKTETEIWIGSDDSVASWLNHQEVEVKPIERGLTIDADRIKVTVNKGWNILMMKVAETATAWSMSVRFKDNVTEKFAFKLPAELQEAVEREGKLTTTWGEMKDSRQ